MTSRTSGVTFISALYDTATSTVLVATYTYNCHKLQRIGLALDAIILEQNLFNSIRKNKKSFPSLRPIGLR